MRYKKYILFKYDQYYPSGGMCDIHDSYNTINEAHNNIDIRDDYFEIVDRDTWEIITSR